MESCKRGGGGREKKITLVTKEDISALNEESNIRNKMNTLVHLNKEKDIWFMI